MSIQENKKQEAGELVLASNSEKYKLLVDSISDYALYLLSPGGIIVSWNRGAEKLYGYAEEEVIGKHFSLLYPAHAKEGNYPEFELEQTKSLQRFEDNGWRITKSGVRIFVNTISTTILSEKGVLLAYSLLSFNATARKESEDFLRQNEEKYRLLVEGVKDYGIFMLSPEGYIHSWNEGAKRLKGYTEREIIGKHFSVFYPEDAVKNKYPEYELDQAQKWGRFEDEGWRIRKDGTSFFANVVITPIFSKEKKIIGYSKITRDLTEKKEAEERLRRSEERYRLLIEGVKDYAIFMLDPSGNIVSWNEGAKKLKGYTESEIVGKHFSIFYPKEAKESNYPEFELEQAKKRGRFEDEGIRIRKDGTTFFANVVITAIYNKEKRLLGYSKITRDLTEKKEAEEKLKLSEERSRMLIEGVRDYAIFMLDPTGHIASWNEGAKRLKRYEEWEIIGKHFSIFYPKELQESGFPEYELKTAEKVGRFEDEGWRIRKDGTRFFANVLITAIFNKDNHLIGFSKITRDLTQKKEAEEQLRSSEEKYRLLVEGVKDYAIFLLDPEGYVTSWNEGAKRLNKYEDFEILGKHFSIFYTEDKRKTGFPQYELEQALKHGKFEDEGLRVKKDGSTYYVNTIITPLYSTSGELIGFSKITRDLTERKLAEEKLTHLNQELEIRVKQRTEELTKTVKELRVINADLDNFVYTASHDLKAPVSNIEGLITNLNEVLKENNSVTPEIDHLLGMIQTSVQRFKNTVKDLTSVSDVQRTGREDLAEINVKEIVEEVMASIQFLINEAQSQIKLNIQQPPSFKFSKIHLRSIFYNFLTNAVKYRSPERQLVISINSYYLSNQFIIEVTDNGLGIKESNKEKIFQLFHRLHTHVEGSGVGLYIVKKIVDNAGGKLEVISKEGQGTTFKILLPI